LRLVLDSNEYIGGLGTLASPSSIQLFQHLTTTPIEHEIYASRVIVEEVRRHFPPSRFQGFWHMLIVLDVTVLEEWEIPSAALDRYTKMGFKPGDAAIAACAEVAGAAIVITENRDFHGRSGLPFRPLRAEEFLKEQGTAGRPATG
jgi:hypothetical protein